MSPPASAPGDIDEKVEQLRNLHSGQAAIAGIVALGDAAVPALEAMLRGPSQSLPHTRCWASDALAAIGSGLATQALIRALRDCASRNPAVPSREAEDVVVSTVAEHVGATRTPDALPTLIAALERRPYPGCVRALAPFADPRAAGVLLQSLLDDTTRGAAMDALRRLGPITIPRLARLLAHVHLVNGAEPPSRMDGRAAAAVLLGTLLPQYSGVITETERTEARRTLSAAVRDPQRAVRIAAALSLSRYSEGRALPAVRMLLGALGDPDWRSAATIMHALTKLGPQIEGAVLEAITSKGRTQNVLRKQRRAIWIAGKLGTPSAVAALESLADHNDLQVRIATVRALSDQPNGDPAHLYRFLNDPAPPVRRLVLGKLCQRRALSVDSAARALGDPDEDVRRLAAASLSEHRQAAFAILARAVLSFGTPLHGWSARSRLTWNALRWIVSAMRTTYPRRNRS
jgi:HEAT repeat protein